MDEESMMMMSVEEEEEEEEEEIEYADDAFVTQDINTIRHRRVCSTVCDVEAGAEEPVYAAHARPEDIARRKLALATGNMRSKRAHRQRVGGGGAQQNHVQEEDRVGKYFDVQMQTLYDTRWNLGSMSIYRDFMQHVAISLFVQDIDRYPRLCNDIHEHIRMALRQQRISYHNKEQLLTVLQQSDAGDCVVSAEFIEEVRSAKTLETARFEQRVEKERLRRAEEGYDEEEKEETVHADKRRKRALDEDEDGDE